MWGEGGGQYVLSEWVVSIPTDTVGHVVGVLGVGLLDTDWSSWAGRCWSLWLLPACQSLGVDSLSSRGSLDRSPFSILTTLLSASRAKILPSLVQVLLSALCLLTQSSRSLFSGVRSSTNAMPCLDYFHSVSPWYEPHDDLENWPALWATLMCCFVMCPSFSFSLIIASTLSSHCVVVSLLLSGPNSTRRFLTCHIILDRFFFYILHLVCYGGLSLLPAELHIFFQICAVSLSGDHKVYLTETPQIADFPLPPALWSEIS